MPEFAYHDSQNERYRSPFGAVPVGGCLRLSIEAEEGSECILRLWTERGGEKRLPMRPTGGLYTAEFTVPEEPGLLWYHFIVRIGGDECRLGAPGDGLGGAGVVRRGEPPSWQVTVYKPRPAPEWYKNSLVYQIFPDRFARGSDWRERREASKRPDDRRGPRRIWHEDWNDTPFYTKNSRGEVTRWDFFGGTFSGIREKLPYLRSLGVGVIYLNPIFRAASNHRYDTADYMETDPLLGSEEDFRALAEAAAEYGIRIILDGVFSHTGADSRYFDYFGNYGGGACSDPDSPYRRWYRFRRYPDDYESWWGVGDLPNVDEEEPSYKEFICTGEDSVARTWLRRGASGWRLDVADELPDSFIADFARSIRAEKSDALLIGEVWEDASNKRSYGVQRRFLFGEELDGTMHYPFRSAVIDFLLGLNDAFGLRRRLMSIAENYPPEALYSALNLIGSHDRMRPITRLGGAPKGLDEAEAGEYVLPPRLYELGRARLMMAALLQFVCPGVPCLYYGDEAGATGCGDPYNRAPYPWGREDEKLLDFYRRLGDVYAGATALKGGKFAYICYDEDLFAVRRWDENGEYIAMVNRSAEEKRVPMHGVELLTGRVLGSWLRIPPLRGALVRLEDGR